MGRFLTAALPLQLFLLSLASLGNFFMLSGGRWAKKGEKERAWQWQPTAWPKVRQSTPGWATEAHSPRRITRGVERSARGGVGGDRGEGGRTVSDRDVAVALLTDPGERCGRAILLQLLDGG